MEPETRTLPAESVVRAPIAVIRLDWSASTDNVLPDLDKPAPALMSPALENCENANEVVPRVMAPFVVHTKPTSALVVPSSTNTKAPLTSPLALKSAALVGAPVALTV